MEKWYEEITPILGVEQDCIISKKGDITVGYRVILPEIFTLSTEDYENLHFAWIKAIKVLPKFSVLHKQDWYTANTYHEQYQGNRSFLNRAGAEHFNGRKFLDHQCYLYLTRKSPGRKHATSMFSSLLRPSIVPREVLQEQFLREFTDCCGQLRQILEQTGLLRLERLTDDDLKSNRRKIGLIERYCTLTGHDDGFIMHDISMKDELRVGNKHCQVYTLGDVEDLPHLCGSRINYEKYSTDQSDFSVGFASHVGLLLPVDHIYNQYLFIDDAQKTIAGMEKRRLRLQSLSAYSRENAIARDDTNDYLNEAISEQRLPVKAHFNVMVWTTRREQLKDIKNQVSAALAQMDAAAKLETVGVPQIYWAGIPGNSADFPMNDTFTTFCEQASCFLALETNYSSDLPAEGVRFCDRISSKPIYLDMFSKPRRLGLTQNMGMLVCGTSGGGKSVVVNHILRSMHDQGAHSMIVDIGGSYKGLCELLGGYYFTYDEKNPISFNPFFLPEGATLDTEKKESLKALLVGLWKQENENFNRSEYVAISNALQGYYAMLAADESIFPCFDTFYEYLQTDYVPLLQQQQVKEKDFDISNFLYVLRPFYKGNEFDYLLNSKKNLDWLNRNFLVFELDNIKDHPILFPVCTLVLIEQFVTKMRRLHGIRKVLIIDEAWKAIAKSGMAEFLKYAFKTIRKFEGVPGVITQELDDLVSSPIIKDAIINNADIKILMDMKKFMHKFDKLQDTLGLSEKAKTVLLSIDKESREFFLDLGGQMCKVLRNELCPEEYYAYTTDGKERVKVMEYAKKHGSVEAGIRALVMEIRHNK